MKHKLFINNMDTGLPFNLNTYTPASLSKSNANSTNFLDKVKSSVTDVSDWIKNKISTITTFAQLLPLIAADTSGYDFRKSIERFASCSLTTEEYNRLVYKIKTLSNYDNLSLPELLHTIKLEIASEKEQRLIIQKREEARIQDLAVSKCSEFCIHACERLQVSIGNIFTKQEYDKCNQLYLDHYDSEIRVLFQKFKDFLDFSQAFANIRNNPNLSDNNHYEDDKYLAIARKYILYSNSMTIEILRKFEFLSSAIGIFDRFYKKVAEITDSSTSEILEVPITTIGLLLLWGAMSFEFLFTAYGDIDISKEQMISASISIFCATFIVALAREGIPPQFCVDMGITHCIQKIQQTAYVFFHDIAKPIVDFGVDYANVAFNKNGMDLIITKNRPWNEILYERISSRLEILPLRMGMALPMLHTFRVADAFFASLKNGISIFSGTLKDNLLKLSPIPHTGEDAKLISLFWENPYSKNSVVKETAPTYGLFFNYNREIDFIYEKYTSDLTDDKVIFLYAAVKIYHSIRELNYYIGKGNPQLFDDYLVYCIAGKLIDKYYKPCLGNVSQHQLASEIYQYINSQPRPAIP